MISNLVVRASDSPEPQVGDEVYYAGGLPTADHQPRRFLAIRIGPDATGELWLAWNMDDGTMQTVSVGRFWKLRDRENK